MPEGSGQDTIRGIDIDKLAKGFADEAFVFKQFLTVSPTSAREIRWYQKTAGTLSGSKTTGMTSDFVAGIAQLGLPTVQEASWSRNTSYVRKYFVESPWISYEDIRDSDPDVLATNVRDLTRAVANQVDARIYGVLSASVLLSGSAMGAGWDDASAGNPILDMLSGSAVIRAQGYDIGDIVVFITPNEYKNLLNYIITVKGSSIPAFSSDKAESGVLLRVLGNKIVVSQNATLGMPLMLVPNRAATWKTFMPITAQQKEEVGIGVKIRVWEEGEVLFTDPNAAFLIKAAN